MPITSQLRIDAAPLGSRRNPTALKKFATGNGRAKKPQMIRAAATLLGVNTTDDNIADACFVLDAFEWPRGKLD